MQSEAVCQLQATPEETDLSAKDCLRFLFVAALDEQTDGAWKEVLEYCSKLSVSEREELSSEPSIQHYVHRSLQYAEHSSDPTELVGFLTALLPEAVEQCKRQRQLSGHSLSLSTNIQRIGRRKKARKRVVSLDSGLAKLLTFSPTQIAATFRGPELQLSELVPAASVVSHEMVQQSKTALSPPHPLLPPTLVTTPHHHQHQKPLLSPVYHTRPQTDRKPDARTELKRKLNLDETRKGPTSEAELHTAYDVIAAFAKGSLQAGAESVYLNCTPGSPWNPYHLTVVPRTRANPEHYLISKFGILHVQPGGNSDLQGFAEWLREAGLFSLCQQISFFSQFLVNKMFRCWHGNVRYREFVRLHSEVERVGLRFFPEFHRTIDKIHKLNTELLNFQTLSLAPLGGYSAEVLEKKSEETEAKTHRLLQRYFKYCKRVVSEAVSATQENAEKLEEEKKHQPFVSDSPISVQVAQYAELERKLGVATYRASRLGDFVCLGEQMIAGCLLERARQSASLWVEGTLQLTGHDSSSTSSFCSDERGTSITEEQSDSVGGGNALLIVDLKISERGGVVTQPSTEKIMQLLSSPLISIRNLLSSTCTTATPVSDKQPHPLHSTEGAARADPVKTVAVGGRVYKPLLHILKGINLGGSGSGSVPESSRARSRLEEAQAQHCTQVRAREGYSTSSSPLAPHNMQEKLQQDPVLQRLADSLQEVLDGLGRELSAVCQKHLWLDHTQSLLCKCKRETISDMTAENFETVLGELHTALTRLSHLPLLLPTSHSLVTISTVQVASQLEPQLQQTVSRLQRSLAAQALEVATQLLRDTLQHTQMLSSKRYDLEGFVQYARSLRESQTFHAREAANTQRVADIHSTLKKYSISVSEEARETLQSLQRVWGEFQACLVEGEEFVKKQTPIKAQGLQESISILEEQLEELVESVGGGDFTDPSASPQSLLLRLESTAEEMSVVRSRLMELSKWEEAITGRHHDLSRMFHCFDLLYARQELWKYRRQFDSCDYDWSHVPFRKLDIAYVEQKVCEWWDVCDKLGNRLPATDPVLEQWRERVEKMHTNIPTLQLLASRDIQTSHWHTIFAGFNEHYDPGQNYTLLYFLERDPCKLSDRITEVHRLASQQSRLRGKFLSMEKMWETKCIELRQMSAERYSFCLPPTGGSQRHTTITFQDLPETSVKGSSEADREQLETVERGEDLEREIEAAVLELNVMLSSPHLGRLKKKVKLLRSSLCQVSELFQLLLNCQDQWQDLLELFLHTKPSTRKCLGLQQLQLAGSHMKEVMDSIHGDPHLFSLLSKSRGRKGVRDLQGPELRKKLKTVLQFLEKVMVRLRPRLEEAELQWPRLGYLTRREKLKAISCRGDPLAIIPLIGRVFPSITTLHYVETSFSSDRDSGQGYQVTGVEGRLREHLPLVLPLPLEKRPAVEWLAGLEKAIKFSLASRLSDCLATLPPALSAQPLTSGGVEEVVEWLGGNVEQNVLLTLDIHWSHRLLKALTDTPTIQAICSQLKRALENSVQLLLRYCKPQQEGEQNFPLILHLLRSIIIYLRRKIDFADSLLTADDPHLMWQLHIHYTTEPVMEPGVAESSADTPTGDPTTAPENGQMTPVHPSSSSLTPGHTPSPYMAGRNPLHIAPPAPCFVQAGGSAVVYGFEYYSPAPQIVLTPGVEAAMVATISSMAQHSFPCVSGEQNSATVKQAAKVMGRHLYHHTCCHLTSSGSLLHLLHTALSSGSILSLDSPHTLPTATQLKLRQYLHTLQHALAVCFTHQPSESSGEYLPPPTPSGCPPRVASSRLDWYGALPSSPSSPNSLSLEHMGKTLSTSPNFGCCVILEANKTSKLSSTRLRHVSCVEPDLRLTVEVLLLSNGFSSAYNLSSLLVGLSHELWTELGKGDRGGGGGGLFLLPWLHQVINLAADLLHCGSWEFDHKSERALELEVAARAVVRVTAPFLPTDKTWLLEKLVSSHLGSGVEREGLEEELVKAVEEEMRERHLQIKPEVTNKIVQLHQSLGRYSCTILLGPRKSGITTCYRTLASAYVQMGRPPIAISVINPAAYSWEQLFGGYCSDEDGSEQWVNGILSRLLLHIRDSGNTSSPHWVVLDGPHSPSLLDTLTTLISDDGLCLPGVERVKIPTNCRLLLKPGPLPDLSPALLGGCGLLHWSPETLTHEMLVDSWLDRAPTQHDLSGLSISYLANVLQSMVPESLQYLGSVCSQHHTSQAEHCSPGVAETLSLLNLLSAMLERNCPTREGTATYSGYGSRSSSSLRSSSVAGSLTSSRCGSAISQVSSVAELPDQLPPLTPDDPMTPDRGPSAMDFSFSASNLDSVETQTLCILTFAFIWSIGAYVPFSELESFNEFALGQISDLPMSVSFPDEGSVFDYYLDLQTFRFEPWSKRRGRLAPKSNGFIPTPDLSRVAYVAELYLSYGHNVLLLGDRGSGKTSFIESLLQSNLSATRFPITRSLTVAQLHMAICSKVTEVSRMDKMRWGSRKVGIPGQNCLFFLDDLHLSYRDNLRDSQPSITQLVSFASRHSCLPTFPDDSLCHMNNIQYLASSLPGHQLTHLAQILGSFHPVPLFPPSDQALHTIFSTSAQLWFKRFPDAPTGDPEPLAQTLSVASVAVFRSVCARLAPCPSHPEWLISLRHLMDVFKGLLLMPLDTKTTITTAQFGLLNRRATPSTGSKSSSRKTSEKSARKSSSLASSFRRGTARAKPSVHLPPVKKESNLRSKIKSELKGKKQQHHDSSQVQATLHRLVRLWCHENTRVYADRMTESRDRAWFLRLLETCVKYCFCGVGFEKTATSTGRGGRLGRRGRGVSVAAQSVGLDMAKLTADGVRADVLQTLLPRSPPVATAGDTEQRETSGELIPLNQVITRGEDVTALIFCKLPTVRAAGSARSAASSLDEGSNSSDNEQGETEEEGDTLTERVYQELGDGQVLETLEKHIQRYTSHSSRDHSALGPAPDLVLFQQAMEHITRLCRSLIIPGCHALLLGVPGSGRKSLSRLVAFMMRAQLFELEVGDGEGVEVLKRVCQSAATTSLSPTVLLVSSSEPCRHTHMWSTISQIMSEGTFSGLFSGPELIRLQNTLRKEGFKKTASPQAIARLVQQNLHIVVIWDIDRLISSPIPSSNGAARSDPGLEERVSQDVFSMLCSRCSVVDYYQPWGQRELSEVAQKWWREKTCSLQQGWITSESQLESLADLASHIHLSSLSVLEQSPHHLPHFLLSPSPYTTLLTLAHSISLTLREKDRGREERMCLALEKVAGREEGRMALQEELAALQSQQREVEAQLEEREKNIEACQLKYKSASQEWSKAKRTIASQTETVKSLRSTVAEKMDQVSSLHCSALEALSSVSKNDVLEVMSYREPPASAIPVFNSLCLLFDRPQMWEDCKLLLLSPNFFESLRFFDKDHVQRQKLRQLRAMLRSPQWRADSLEHTSKAVSSLALWIAALLDYHQARDIVKPSQEELAIAEGILTKAELTLVAKQKIMMETKVEFKHAQKERSSICRQKIAIETKITAMEKRLVEASSLLSSLSLWRSRWEEERTAIQSHTLSSPGHAVLVAASIVYLPRVPANSHRSLWECWLGYCMGRVPVGSLLEISSSQHHSSSHQTRVQVDPDFSPNTMLSLEEERARWNHYASFPDTVALDRCIAARKSLETAFIPPPLVLDPHQLFKSYAHELELWHSKQHQTESEASAVYTSPQQQLRHRQRESCVEVVRVSAEGWAQTLTELEEKREKAAVLVLDAVPSTTDGETLVSLLRRRNESLDQTPPPEELFRLYLVMEEGVRETPPPVLEALGLRLVDFTVVDMGLSEKALEFHLLKFILRLDHPEYAARHRALLVDQTFYEDQIATSKERVILSVLESDSLMASPHIKQLAEESLETEAGALDSIRDTKRALTRSRSLVDSYRPLSRFAALAFTEAQRLCRQLGYPTPSLAWFQELMAAQLARQRHGRPPEDPAACQKHVLRLQQSLLLELHGQLKWGMLRRHHLLLPLLVSLAQLLAVGEITHHELRALGKDPALVQGQSESGARPEWLSQQAWVGAQLMESLPVFQGLVSSLARDSESWREYCGQEVSLTSPSPLNSAPSPFHSLLLLSALRPEKISEVVEEFVSSVVGPQCITRATARDSIDHVLSVRALAVPVACLTDSEGDEERMELVLRDSAKGRGVVFRHLELAEDGDRERAVANLSSWSKEGGWVMVSHSHLLEDAETTWNLLTEVMEKSGLQLWVTVPWVQSELVDLCWPRLVMVDHDHTQEILADLRLAVCSHPLTDLQQ